MVARGTRPSARLVGLAAALAALLVAVPTVSGQGPSGRRLALVVGNDVYTDQSVLRNAVNDARAVASALGDVGFAVTRVENADRARLTSALSDFAGSLRDDDVALFYFADPPRRRRPGDVFRDCAECPEMVVLPGGGLAIGRYEVTVGEYRAFVSATGGTRNDRWRDDPSFPQTDRHPGVYVSWDDAQAYVSWLSGRAGATYRLPSESEWERAASGSQPGCDRLGSGPRPDGTCPVGGHGANAAGLSDMVGNVWEWTSDCWEGNCGRRVVRGGSWISSAGHLRPGARGGSGAGYRGPVQGFRVSRTLD